MNEAQRADYYREKAEEISQLARRSRNASVGLELLQIAALFERMADRGKAYQVKMKKRAAIPSLVAVATAALVDP